MNSETRSIRNVQLGEIPHSVLGSLLRAAALAGAALFVWANAALGVCAVFLG